MAIEFREIDIDIKKAHKSYKGRPVLYHNYGFKEYGIIDRVDKYGIWIHLGMNEQPLLVGKGRLLLIKIT